MFPVFNIVDVNCTDVDKKGDSGRRGSSAVEAELEKKAEDFTRYATEEEVLYSTANDPQPQMIPRPQIIPKMDRKWSSTASDPQSRPQMIPKEK